MYTREEIVRRHDDLRQKQESLDVSITSLKERLHHVERILCIKKAKRKEVTRRLNKLTTYLAPKPVTSSEKFRRLAEQVLSPKLFNDLWNEANK